MKAKKIAAIALATMMTCSALTGCGSTINKEAVGATLNGEEISLGFLNFMAKYQQISYDSMYAAYFGGDFWTQEVEEGKTMEDSAKEEVVENVKNLYLLEAHMADYNVEITAEETAAIEAAAKEFMADNSKKAIRQMGATEEYVKEMLRLNTIQQKMMTAIYAEADVTVTDEEAAQRTFRYIKVSSTTKTDSEGNSVDYTEEEKAALAADMSKVATEAQKDFDGTAEENGYEIFTYSYGKDENFMDASVIKAADALKEGEVSSLITTETDYYILCLQSEFDEVQTATKKESMINQKKAEHYNEVCEGYKEGITFELNEEEWANVKYDRLFSIAVEEAEAAEQTEK